MQSFIKFWSSNFLVQVFSKIISFVSNQLLVRLLSPSLFGLWSVRLSLISDTIVFWSRDGVRKSAIRSKNARKYSIIPLLIGLTVFPFVLFFSFRSSPDIKGLKTASVLTSIGSLLELIGEIWAIPQLALMEGKILAKVTCPAFLLRSFSAVILTRFLHKSEFETFPLMLGFGLSNIVFGLSIVGGYIYYCGYPNIELPTKDEFIKLKPFAFQTVLQWLFSQGERMVLIASSSQEQIGVYGLVSDLGSLFARIIFAPVESSVLSLCASSSSPPIEVLSYAARFVVYVGLAAATFGPPLAPKVLSIVYGARWALSDSQNALSAYFRVMPVMAFNGVTEAFSNARLSQNSLFYYNILLSFVTVLYFALLYYFGKIYGIVGSISSNAVNMSLRSIMAISVIFSECGVVFDLFPKAIPVVSSLIIIFSISKITFSRYFIIIPVYGLLLLYSERKLIGYVYKTLINKKEK